MIERTTTPSEYSLIPCIASWSQSSLARSKTKSQTRCSIKKDAGLTRANTTGMRYCCLFFSRGCCPYGWECEYLHTLPDPEKALPDSSKDCFARDKFADYRDDMGGVGTFTRQNRTLYVGRIKETGAGAETEEVVRRHFKEWGDIEHSAFSLRFLFWSITLCTRSTRAAISLRRLRDVRFGAPCTVCQRSNGLSVSGQ